jgi:hypothetical protein
MPKGIMSLFTVKMNRYIGNHDYVWNKGVVLERGKARAEVIETYDARKIIIRISGSDKRDFMTIITEELDRINEQYEKMKVDKMIPCNCSECKNKEKRHYYTYEDLKRRLEKGRQEVECGISYEMVNVRALIDEVIKYRRIERGKPYGPEKEYLSGPYQEDDMERESVFISYSHKDKVWLERVQTHLKALENEGIKFDYWDDTKLKAGMKWREEIEKALQRARVAILLISTDFLASDFITKYELPELLKAAEDDGTTILPLILKTSRFKKHKELSQFQAVNDPPRPLKELRDNNREKVLVKLANRVEELIKVIA